MLKRTIIIVVLSFLYASTVLAQQTQEPKKIERLKDIKTFYVDKLGEGEDARLIRDKVILRLVKAGMFSVVDDMAKADAVMVGTAKSQELTKNVAGSTHKKQVSTVIVRIVTQDKRILWSKEVRTGKWRAKDDADKRLVKELLEAIEREK